MENKCLCGKFMYSTKYCEKYCSENRKFMKIKKKRKNCSDIRTVFSEK